MILKSGVDIRDVRPETTIGMFIVDGCYRYMTSDQLVITSVRDGKHMPTSLHYKGLAFDCRLPYASRAGWLETKFIPELKSILGEQWDVVLEPTHIHIEFDPK